MIQMDLAQAIYFTFPCLPLPLFTPSPVHPFPGLTITLFPRSPPCSLFYQLLFLSYFEFPAQPRTRQRARHEHQRIPFRSKFRPGIPGADQADHTQEQTNDAE